MARRRRGNRRRNSGRRNGSAQRTNGNGRRSTAQRGTGGSGSDGVGFWGDPTQLPEGDIEIRITDDPHAVPRSLGEPPLPGHRAVAEHYFAAIYDRAVATSGALAAAGGLITPDQLDQAPE